MDVLNRIGKARFVHPMRGELHIVNETVVDGEDWPAKQSVVGKAGGRWVACLIQHRSHGIKAKDNADLALRRTRRVVTPNVVGILKRKAAGIRARSAAVVIVGRGELGGFLKLRQ